MVDIGFHLQDILSPGVKVHQPPFKNGGQMSKKDVALTRGISCAIVRIERVIIRLKTFRILQKPFSLNMGDIAEQVFKVRYFCAS